MANRIVVSLAILKVNWDVNRRDYLENFVPLVTECLRSSASDIVTITDVQGELREQFGIRLPQSALKTILKRVKRQGYIFLQNQVYHKDREKLGTLRFYGVRKEVLQKHEALVRHLILFCHDNYDISLSPEEAEQVLEDFLSDEKNLSAALEKQTQPTKREARFLVGSFISSIRTAGGPEADYLDTVVKGNMLAHAVFLPNPSESARRFRKTTVFFDTNFLLAALGYEGIILKEPRLELLDLLYEAGAELRCFSHTLDEARGALNGIAHKMATGNLSAIYGPSGEHFLAQGYSSSDVFLLAAQLEKSLEGLRIKVVDKPELLHEHMMDESALGERLNQYVRYRNQEALWRDVTSISAIMRLRRGRTTVYVEESRSIFVTSNTELAKAVSHFFLREGNEAIVPPCVRDSNLMNLIWLKLPMRAPDLPWKRVIADCYAAMQPDERLWHLYLQEIEKLEKGGKVSADDYYLLRHSLEARSALMELTLGDQDAFVEGTVPDILSRVKEQIRHELQEKLDAEVARETAREEEIRKLTATIQKTEKEIADERTTAQHKQLAIEQRIKIQAESTAARLFKLIRPLAGILLLVGSLSTFPWSIPSLKVAWMRYVLTILQSLAALLAFSGLISGTALNSLLRKTEVNLAKKFEQRLRRQFLE